MSVHDHTLRNPFCASPALLAIEDRLLGIKHIPLCRVHHPQSPEGLCRRQHRREVSCPGHHQRILSALVEVEHAVCQQPLLRQGQIHAVTPERCLHLICSGSLHDLVPALMPHQIVHPDQFIHVLVISAPLRILQWDAIITEPRHRHRQRPLWQQPGIDRQLHRHEPARRPQMPPSCLHQSDYYIYPHHRPYQPIGDRNQNHLSYNP